MRFVIFIMQRSEIIIDYPTVVDALTTTGRKGGGQEAPKQDAKAVVKPVTGTNKVGTGKGVLGDTKSLNT
ncbi:M4 family metallopeptidase, partial [Bacillus cereus]